MKPYFTKIVRGKLSLCSRDVEVGDQVYYNDKRAPTHLWTERNEEFDKYLQPYKIIGEISPDAKWVKEDDEFDKEDLIVNGLGVNWNSPLSSMNYHTFKIKCPTCGKFH